MFHGYEMKNCRFYSNYRGKVLSYQKMLGSYPSGNDGKIHADFLQIFRSNNQGLSSNIYITGNVDLCNYSKNHVGGYLANICDESTPLVSYDISPNYGVGVQQSPLMV